jgi:hypothetical protein
MKRLLTATALLAFVDFCWAIVLTWFYGRPPMSVWNGVASTAFGPEMLQAGTRGILVGLAMHVSVAFTWSLVFVTAHHLLPALRRLIARPLGAAIAAATYGPCIWIVMSGLVVPTLTGNPLTITPRWFIQLAGHAVFVGLPVVLATRTPPATAAPR